MKDKEFDKIIKDNLKNDEQIPNEINQLFSNFEMEVKMNKLNNKNNEQVKSTKGRTNVKYISIAASLLLVLFVGGSTYAHINGNETLISPILRKLGVNSKYEENATKVNKDVEENNVQIKMLDLAVDDTSLIVGYEINMKNANMDNWVKMEGDYSLNNISITPINYTVDRNSNENEYIYYQIFDINELKIKDKENIQFKSNIRKISVYHEVEDLDSAHIEYDKEIEGNWNFEEKVNIKNLEENKVYTFKNKPSAKILKNVNISAVEFIEGSYTNILKIQKDKTNYSGDAFELYYKLLDENNKEITCIGEEERQYDYTIANDRLVVPNISNKSKIKVEIYCKVSNESYKKAGTLEVDISKATEKEAESVEYKKYENREFGFKYNKNWKVKDALTAEDVGPNSRYIGAIMVEIPSTTNDTNPSSIFIKDYEGYTLEKYVAKMDETYKKEYFEKVSENKINIGNNEGKEITYTIADGEENYIYKSYVTIKNGKIYEISFSGSDKEYNNLKEEINTFIESFIIE